MEPFKQHSLQASIFVSRYDVFFSPVCAKLSCCVSDHMYFVVLAEVKVDFAALREFAVVADGPGRGVLLFPEICTMELQLLATGSPDLDVLNHVFHSLLGAVHANPHNATLLYEQVRLTISTSFLLYPHISAAELWSVSLIPVSDRHREESKPSCLVFTTSWAKQTPPLQVCYFSGLFLHYLAL